MKLEAIAQSVLATLLVAAIGGGLVLWADMRAMRAELPGLKAEVHELRKALEANSIALAVLDARSQREARAQGRSYTRAE